MRGNNERPDPELGISEPQEAPTKNELGATATEYALLLGVLAIGLMASLSAFGGVLRNVMTGLANTVGGWA